jgi:feruloyl esterase
MIDYLRDSFHVDTSQIYIYGLSAGAVMSSVMMANYPWLFRAGAVLAGGPYGMGTGAVNGLSAIVNSKNKTSKEWGELVEKNNPGYKGAYPNLIVAHGKKDKVVNPKNSIQLIKQFAYLLHTDTVPSDTLKSFAKNADVTKYIYLDKQKNQKIFYYEIDHLGHALIIDPGDDIMHGGETGLFSVDKDFFSTYWIAKDFGLIRYD